MFRKMKWFVVMLLVLGFCTDAVLAELIGYWPFDEGQGTEAADITGNGNDGTLSGGVEWVPGYKDSAVHLDTAGERVVINALDPTAENNAMTLTAWINWEGQDHSITHQGIFGKRQGWDPRTNVKWFWEAQPDGDVAFRNGDTSVTASGVLDAYANEWVHVAMTWDNGAVVQYINAEQVSTGNITFRDTADATVISIGCVSATSSETFVGSIDEARIYNHVLTQSEIQTIMLGIFPTAFSPDPADGAIHEDTWVSLSWKPGTSAVSHDVYFGENFDDVNDGAEGIFYGNQDTTFFVVGFPGFPYQEGLVPGTTYYWRVDEIEADGTTTHKGKVWSFMVPPKTAYAPGPAEGTESIDPDADLSWTAGFGSKLHYVYFGDNFDDVNNADGGLPQGVTTYNPGTLKMAKTYYWRVDEFDIFEMHKGEVWSFTTQGAVGSPDPANGAVDVKQTSILTWTPGVYAASHQVYFGTDEDAVKNADTGSPEYKGTGDLGAQSYDPGKLELGVTYYWRIDEVNNVNPDSPWIGNLWSFTTTNLLIVDDFEDYDAGDNQIWYAWKDGLGYGTPGTDPYYAGNGSGLAVGDETTASFTEETIVHGGIQSMPLFYDNNQQLKAKYSEAELTLTYLRDWTENGINTLTIWFRGNPTGLLEEPAGTYTMSASGVDIWDQADEFRYAWKQLSGAGTISAQVLSVQNTDPWAKAGVMIRETLDPGSKFAFVCVTPGNGLRFQGRLTTGASATSDTSVVTPEQTAITAPYWVKLERDAAGNFNGYYSSDGVSWQTMTWNPQRISMPSNVYIGLALTSHSSGVTCTAEFSNVQTTGTVTPMIWTQEAIGVTMAANDAEPMYVALNGNAVVFHDNPNAALIDTWTEWNIDLQAFADQGVNLANVNTIAIGFGDKKNPQPGGSGTAYFDDIRLYRLAP